MPRQNSKFAGRFDKQILVYHIAGLDEKDISKSLNVSLKLVLSVLDTYNKMSSEDVRELHSIMGLEIPSQMNGTTKRNSARPQCVDLTENDQNGVDSGSETPSEHSSKNLRKRVSRKVRSGLTKIESNLNTDDSPLLQADHEAFIRTFAVNTHLYRYLAECFRSNPILLHRTLRYLIPRNKPPRRSLEDVISSLRKSRNSRRKLTNGVPLAPNTPCMWPLEVEIVFEAWQDSPKETEWTTVDATVDLRARFGFCWRRKACPPDTLLVLSRGGCPAMIDHLKKLELVKIPCEPAIPVKVAQHNSTNSIKLSLEDLLHRARLSDGLSVKRIKSAHLEIHVSAEECRKPKSSISNGGLHPKRNSSTAASPASFPVSYASAPLPIFLESLDYPGDVSMGPSPLCLTPGRYELRMGLETDEYLTNEDVDKVEEGQPTLIKTKAKNHVSVNGAGSGRLQWNAVRAMRFPGASTVLDDYERWPTVRFRVNWINTQVPVQPEETNGHAVSTQSSKSTTPRKRSWSSSSSDSSHAERVTRSRVSSEDEKNSTPSQTKSESASNASASPTSSHTRSSTKKGQTNLHMGSHSLADKNFIKKEEKKPFVAPLMSSSLTEKVPCTVTYRFLYAGRLQQWTEAQDLICPFCKFNCWQAKTKGPEALVSHLRAFHCRFRFEAKWNPAKLHLSIEVCMNDTFDCSNDCGLRRWAAVDSARYCKRATVLDGRMLGGWDGLGSPCSQSYQGSGAPSNCTSGSSTPKESLLPNSNEVYQFSGVLGESVNSSVYALSRGFCRVRRPIRRPPFTELIFWHGLSKNLSWLSDPTLSLKPRAVGHNRVYYHTWSCQPIRTCEFEEDSETEDNCMEWLRQHYQRKLEEFTDVNAGEKKVMQLWNAYLLGITPSMFVVSDSLIGTAVVPGFVEKYGPYIAKQGLRFNLLLHLTNLVEYGLLSSKRLRICMDQFDRLVSCK